MEIIKIEKSFKMYCPLCEKEVNGVVQETKDGIYFVCISGHKHKI